MEWEYSALDLGPVCYRFFFNTALEIGRPSVVGLQADYAR